MKASPSTNKPSPWTHVMWSKSQTPQRPTAWSDNSQLAKALRSALDIMPDDPDLMAEKAAMYQAEGNLQEAAKLLAKVNAQILRYGLGE